MHIGAEFQQLYASPGLAKDFRENWFPWLLDGKGPAGDPAVELGDQVLSICGGASTQFPAERVTGELTVAYTGEVDLERLPWPDGRFSAVIAPLVLHHLPDTVAQDRALAEWLRVLRPGGVLAGINPIEGPHFRRLDQEGWCLPIEPLGFPERLRAAGFADVLVRVWSLVGFLGYRGIDE